jgi:hypothetical protein
MSAAAARALRMPDVQGYLHWINGRSAAGAGACSMPYCRLPSWYPNAAYCTLHKIAIITAPSKPTATPTIYRR